MPSSFFGLDIGKTGLYAYQAALNTTGHNITNTNTLGYTRQVSTQKAGEALRVNSKYGMAGTGVQITGVEQIRNTYYDVKYRNNSTLYGMYSTKDYYMSNIQNYFNEVSLEGFTTSFDSFYDALQELSKNSAGLPERQQVVNFGQSMCEYFNNMSNGMTSIQEECNFEIKTQVDKINSISQQIATLTQQINTLECNGGTANDLRDSRNLLVDELSKIASVTTSERIVGNDVGVSEFNVYLDDRLLVESTEYNELQVVPRSAKVNQNDIEGIYDVRWKNGQNFNAYSSSLGGTLGALFEMRDGNNLTNLKGTGNGNAGDSKLVLTSASINDINKLNIPENGIITVGNSKYEYTAFNVDIDADGKYTYTFDLKTPLTKNIDDVAVSVGESVNYKGIPYYMAQLNEFVRTFSSSFNEIHKQGQDLKGDKGLDFFNAKDIVTGENYKFTDKGNLNSFSSADGSYYRMTAANFTITEEIYKDPNKIAIAENIVDGVEEKNILEKLIALKSDKSMFKQGQPASFLQTLVAEVGVDAKKTYNFALNQENILNSIENQRLSVSGVDEEEEAMNLIKFKHCYDLCAKVISVMDEIYDKLINEMGV